MKKLLFSLMIAFSSIILQPVMAAMPTFSPSTMAQHTLESLDFTDIIHELYQGQTSEPYVEDERINAMSHTQLGYGENGEQIIGIMHPVVTYKNTAGETRYLVMIEKLEVSSVNYKLIECHVCSGTADLFTFKRLNNGAYQLVSRTTDDVVFPGSWGRVNLDPEILQDNIEPLGRNIVGSIFESGYMSTGTYEGVWNALHLSEDDYIRFYSFGDAGGDSSGYFEEGSPRLYAYTSTYEVQPDGSTYYPIKITYSGTKPNWDNNGYAEPANYSVIARFDTSKNNYE